MLRRILAATLAAAGLAMAAPAFAADADAIRQGIVGYLKSYASFLSYREVTVEAQGGAFEVRLSGLRYPMGVGRYLDFAPIAARVAPAGEALYRVDDVRFPASTAVRDEDGAEVGRLGLSLEHLAGLYSATIRNFLDLDMAISKIAFVLPAEGVTTTLAAISARSRGSEGADGLWDLVVSYRARDLRVVGDGAGALEIAEIGSEGEVWDLDLEAYGRVIRGLEGQLGEGEPEEILTSLLGTLDDSLDLFGGFDVSFDMAGLGSSQPGAGSPFALERIALGLSVADFDRPLSRAKVSVEHAGLQLAVAGQGDAASLVELAPQALSITLAGEKIPMRHMLRALLGFVGTVAGDLGDPQAADRATAEAGLALGAEVQSAMAKAGTTVRLERSAYRSPAVQADLDGALQIDDKAALGAVGTLDARVVGYDRMLQILLAAQQQQALAMLALIQPATKRSQDEAGRVVDSFRFDLTSEGRVMINGQALDELLAPQ